MLDVENELRELLDRKAEANMPQAPAGLPDALRRRTRYRQAVTTALAGLLSMAVVAASVTGLSLLRGNGPEKVSLGSPPFTVHQPPLPQGPGRYLLAEGDADGQDWTVLALDDVDGIGLELDSGDDATRLNPQVVPDQEAVEALPRGFGVGPDEYVHIGAVVREAATVEAVPENGDSVPGAVVSLGPAIDVEWSAFVVQHSAIGATSLIFRDADGVEVARIEVDGSPSNPQQGDEVGVFDRYKNPLGFTRFDDTGDVAWTEPGGTATAGEMRATARTVLTRVMEEAHDWWTARPSPETSPDIELEDWWGLYPLSGTVEETPTYVNLADCARTSIQDHEIPAHTPTVAVFFSCTLDPPGDPMVVHRIDREYAGAAPLTQALENLFAGPTRYEAEHGFVSFFSEASADLLNVARVEGSHATVDLKPFSDRVDGNSGTSTGGMLLIASLSSTVFQLEHIESITFQVNGDCDRFWRWFESTCDTVERATWREHTRVVE